MGVVILIGSGLVLYALRSVIPYWLGCLILFMPWGVYNYLYDDTRVGHSGYKSSSAYSSCLKSADFIYRERLQEALADPEIWQLGGYTSARDYAAASKRGVISRCNK